MQIFITTIGGIMFGKIENGRLVIAGYKIQIENGWITNPTEEQLRKLGYKTVEYTDKPEYDKEEEKLQEVYTNGETITVSYEKVALTDEEHNNIIQKEIEQEEIKITARNIRNAIKGDSFALAKIEEIETNIQALRIKLRIIQEEQNAD